MREYYLIVCVERARSFDKLFNLYTMMSISIIYPWKALLLVSNNDSGINGIQFIFIDWGMWYNERGMQILISFCLCFSFLYASWCRIWWAVSGSPFPFISFLFSPLFFCANSSLTIIWSHFNSKTYSLFNVYINYATQYTGMYSYNKYCPLLTLSPWK